MSKPNSYTPITKEQIDQLAAEMDTARGELNRMGGELRTVSADLLAVSNQLDDMIIKYMKLTDSYKKQGSSK